ncbi:hypothetical protein C6361_07405 [Plantactinospora sp. BC1]|nr:hypothetical protein C6361_07405 [Plantactinospora sp. BC1]AVT35762.1 hypothetical protein C6W10_03995 [Plantactinospora sp. BB1]
MSRVPRAVQWLLLAAMTCTFVGQVLTGFGRPVNVVAAWLSGVLALWCAASLYVGRRDRPTR